MRLWPFSSSAWESDEKLRGISGRTLPLLSTRHAVVLVRDEGERDRVRPVELAQRLEERAAEARVAGRIGREGRREVRPVEVAGRARRAA